MVITFHILIFQVNFIIKCLTLDFHFAVVFFLFVFYCSNFIFYLGSPENYFDFDNSGHENFDWDYFEWTKSIYHN